MLSSPLSAEIWNRRGEAVHETNRSIATGAGSLDAGPAFDLSQGFRGVHYAARAAFGEQLKRLHSSEPGPVNDLSSREKTTAVTSEVRQLDLKHLRPIVKDVAAKVTKLIGELEENATYSPLDIRRVGARYQQEEKGTLKVMFRGEWSWETFYKACDVLRDALTEQEKDILRVRLRFPDASPLEEDDDL